MKFTVVWQPSAVQELARLWTAATDRDLVAKAADEIDALLRQSAMSAGEARSGATRILVEHPLAVVFDVSEDDCLATVLGVWRSK